LSNRIAFIYNSIFWLLNFQQPKPLFIVGYLLTMAMFNLICQCHPNWIRTRKEDAKKETHVFFSLNCWSFDIGKDLIIRRAVGFQLPFLFILLSP